MTRRPDPADAVNAQLRAAGYTPLADIVEALTARRESLGWSQRRLAQLLGVNQSTVAGWETPVPERRVTPGADALLAWARALGIDLAPIPAGTHGAFVALLAAIENSAAARTDSPDSNDTTTGA